MTRRLDPVDFHASTKPFTVIIPTLQRSDELRAIVSQCARHQLVQEVIVINNAAHPISFRESNVRVLNQEQNIFVNPAWNLGVAEAKTEYIALVNDDIRFEDEALDHSARVLRRGFYSIVGPDKTCFRGHQSRNISHRIAPFDTTTFGFGTFMCMRRNNYVPIPEEMPIWGGDDWLFIQQRRPNAVLVHTEFRTKGSTTTSSPEFAAMRSEQQEVCARILDPLAHTRWWHRPVEWIAWARWTRYSILRRARQIVHG